MTDAREDSTPAATEFKYRAFISYSHADEEWAKWLHKALETYRVPKRLVGRATPFGAVPERLAPVFRDRDELATATNLGEILTAALEGSACQLVICSRKAARSRWVNEEIKTFKRLGRSDRIFAVIVDGEPHASGNPATTDQECFPPALILKVGPHGELTDEPTEPVAADLRPGKDGRLDVKLKLIAGMLGVGLDELKQREAHRRQRRMMYLVTASVAGMAVTSALAGAAWIARNDAERQRVRAEQEAETARQTTNFMVGLFKVSDPNEALGNTITAREILDKGAARIGRELVDQPQIQATLMDTMGTVYTSLGLYDAAVPLVRQALERRQQLWGAENAEVASSLNHLGEVLTLKSDYAEADRHLRDALQARRRLHGPESAEVAQTLTLLADLLRLQGNLPDASRTIDEAIAIRRTLARGKPTPELAVALETRGIIHSEAGEYDKAVEVLRENAAMRQRLHPAVHPEVANSLDNLALALIEAGKTDDAEPLLRLALATKRQVYGETHPSTTASLNNLAYVLELRGKYAEAADAYLAALDSNRKLLGDSHPTVAVNMSNLAYVKYAQGEIGAAIALLRDSLAMTRKELGSEHPDVASRASGLALWLVDENQQEEARELIDESLAIRRKALGNQHPQVAGTVTIKAYLLLKSGRFQESYELAEHARRILDESLGADRWQTAFAMSVEGAALMRMGRYAEAEPLLVGSQAGLKSAPIPNLADRGRLRLIELYQRWGKPDEVARLRAGG